MAEKKPRTIPKFEPVICDTAAEAWTVIDEAEIKVLAFQQTGVENGRYVVAKTRLEAVKAWDSIQPVVRRVDRDGLVTAVSKQLMMFKKDGNATSDSQ